MKINITLIGTAISLFLGCEEMPQSYSKTETINSNVVYKNLDARKIDEEQIRIGFEMNSYERMEGWNNITNTRAVVETFLTCDDANEVNRFYSGTGVIVDNNTVLTVAHAVEDVLNICVKNKKFEIKLELDRHDKVQQQHWDSFPPALWLLKNRLHALSLIETNMFTDGLDPNLTEWQVYNQALTLKAHDAFRGLGSERQGM